MESKIAEERGADEQAQTQPAVVFVVVEKVLAITVVEVQHDELIVLLADAEPHIDDGVEIQVPAFALDKSDVGHPAFVGRKELCSSLENATILKNVFVLLAVNDGNPELGMHHQPRVDQRGAAEGHLVPAARGLTITAIGFMLKQYCRISHKPPLVDNQVLNTDARVEVQVVEWQRFFKDIPHRLLRIAQEKVAVEGKNRLGEALAETDLELHIAVVLGGFLVQGRAQHKVIVLVDTKKRPAVKVMNNAVHIYFSGVPADIRDLCSRREYDGNNTD